MAKVDQSLIYCTTLTITPPAPFNFDGSVFKPSHFPSLDSAWEPGRLWFTQRLGDELYGIRLENLGSLEQPRLGLNIFSDQPLPQDRADALRAEIVYCFDLEMDLNPFYARAAQDPLIQPILERWKGMRLTGNPLYESLIIYIVLQNATVRRTVQMLDNLFRAYGTLLHFDGRHLYGYWSSQIMAAAPEEELHTLKVGYRAKSLRRVSQQIAAGELDEHALRRLPDPELRKELLNIYGIGPASAWGMMFDVFHRYGAFEHISPWEQKIFSHLLFDQELAPAQQILQEVERRWGPWKMLAAHYLFEDLFWRRKNEPVEWLEELIRL